MAVAFARRSCLAMAIYDGEKELKEALRRSLAETTREESLLADAFAASVTTRDEEIALDLQRGEFSLLDSRLRNEDLAASEIEARRLQDDEDALAAAEVLQQQTAKSMNPASLGSSSKSAASARNQSATWTVVGARPNAPQSQPVEQYTHQQHQECTQNVIHPSYTPSTSMSSQPTPHRGTNTTAAQAIPQQPPQPRTQSEYAPSYNTPPQTSNTAAGLASVSPTRGVRRYMPPSLYNNNQEASKSPDSQSDASIPKTSDKTSPPMAIETEEAPHSQEILNNTMHTSQDDSQPAEKRMVVIDGQNVACAFGGDGKKSFRSEGIEIVIDYYSRENIDSFAIVPRNKVDERGFNTSKLADNPSLLRRLQMENKVGFAPAAVHDDNYILHIAMKEQCDIISNDRFAKEVKQQKTVEERDHMQAFLDEHLIPYMFVKGKFCPNPATEHLGSSAHQGRGSQHKRN